jgi:hypothetical protein
MIKRASVLILMLGFAASTVGQTSGDFSDKYRQIISYEIRPGIVMTPKYAADGQVCQIYLERRQQTEKELLLGYTISAKDVMNLVDELAPKAQRGNRLPAGTKNDAAPQGRLDGDISTYVRERPSPCNRP